MEIWIVLVEDRHAEVDALPFSTENAAIADARTQVEQNASHPEDIEWDTELNPAMLADNWVFYVPYSVEGDHVRVVKRTLDGDAHG